MMKPEGENLVCANCGREEERGEPDPAFVSTERQRDDEVIESTPDANFEGKPTSTDVVCDECGNEEAWYALKQTASADEPPTRFFKCTECGRRWREYN